VIHAMGGEQDIRKMGGLREKIPITYWTFLIATIAIAGFPPFAGFFSKDEILASSWSTPYFRDLGKIIYVLGTIAALFTAFYMYRLVYLVFYGKFRGTHEQEHHLHESPPTMTIPLIVLAALSVVGGFFGIPHVIGQLFGIHHFLAEWLETIFPVVARAHEGIFEIPGRVEVIVMIVSTLAALLGWQIARALYRERGVAADQSLEQRRPGLIRTLANKYYIDEVYDTLFVQPLYRLSMFFWKVIDAIIDGTLSFGAHFLAAMGDLMRFLQTGNVRNYALMFFLGVVVFIWIYL
jgi:NADH-quinone oxidoreductase subunit L